MRLLVAIGMFHEVVPDAVTVAEATCHVLPLQYRLSLERWMIARTLATPEGESAAVPQIRAVGEQPAVQRVEL